MTTATQALPQLQEYAETLQDLFFSGSNLRAISRATYEMRESGKAIPYMAIADTEKGGTVARLNASPAKAQKVLAAFFAQKIDNSRLPKYVLEITPEGVGFWERRFEGEGKGKRLIKTNLLSF